ncbi:hypothetical protein J5N97_006049 [Dioscorea zingiberensis]|uniref:Dof zinc finger protein n=1 Tax=Dioscorea zingiberensis TaxID=325984 RepID=A0A9D5HSX1_9LILI|nr:hypothetical protein J5N97_006049 [Dioscorea zingiberensis]
MESSTAYNQQEIRKARPQPEQALKCPRCESTNTKFCYYNNYSLSQPRYFCKGCRRYWTHGGSLRNVPVGGGCRKNRRSSSSSSSSSSKKLQDHQALPVQAPIPIPYMAMDNHVPFFLGNTTNTNSNTNTNLNFVEHSGMENVFFGFGGNIGGEMVLGGATSAGASDTSKVASQWLPWQVGDADVSLGLDTGRECWNGVGSSSWQGLINSSLMM